MVTDENSRIQILESLTELICRSQVMGALACVLPLVRVSPEGQHWFEQQAIRLTCVLDF
jgi:hypothetical protein